MSVFAIGDLHLSLSAGKSMEVFKGWENYVERIEEGWRNTVGEKDTVVITGDVSWEMHLENTVADFSFINSLPGKKIILKGNHDLWWNSLSKMNRFTADNGFTSISFLHNNYYTADGMAISGSRGWFFDDSDDKILLREAGRVRTSISRAVSDGYTPVVFLHYPPVLSDRVCDEIFSVLRELCVKRVYYGHIHKGGAFKVFNGEHDGIMFKCVSSDMVDFTPVLVEKSD